LIGFTSEDDWLDHQLERDPRFLRRIEQARNSLREGGGVRIANFGVSDRRFRRKAAGGFG
jgi:hypothetical protein